jgi:hypothetical protein
MPFRQMARPVDVDKLRTVPVLSMPVVPIAFGRG